jgi:hypothetical protein
MFVVYIDISLKRILDEIVNNYFIRRCGKARLLDVQGRGPPAVFGDRCRDATVEPQRDGGLLWNFLQRRDGISFLF